MWSLYALFGIFIIFFPMLASPGKNTMKYLWISYILLGVLLGLRNINKNKEDDSIDGFGCSSCSK